MQWYSSGRTRIIPAGSGPAPVSLFTDAVSVQDCHPFAFEDVSGLHAAPGPTASAEPATPSAAEAAQRFLFEEVSAAEGRGYERGVSETSKQSLEDQRRLAKRLDGALETLNRALDRTEREAAGDALELGLKVAEKLVRGALIFNPEALRATLIDAAAHTEGEGPLKIVGDKKVVALLREQLADFERLIGVEELIVEEDSRLRTGDLMVYRGSATLDARVSTRLERIEHSLMRELGLAGTAEGA